MKEKEVKNGVEIDEESLGQVVGGRRLGSVLTEGRSSKPCPRCRESSKPVEGDGVHIGYSYYHCPNCGVWEDI